MPPFGKWFINHTISMPSGGWPVLPRPQPWYPQHPTVSVPLSAPMLQQPLFPVQNVRPLVHSVTSSVLPPSMPSTPPGMSAAAPVPVYQPLFPVVPTNNVPQNSPFFAPMPPNSIALSSSADPHVGSYTSASNSYHGSGIPAAAISVNSHSYASGPNTGGPSIGPPPIIANKAPVTHPATNEVYLVWDEEAMSLEERRMSLLKYQVHDETSQMSSIDAAIDRRISESRLFSDKGNACRLAF